jgi:2-polyprenyl-3-methyl-5-hydroxy-6-metoxy-1,4-benzoquinol methylase
MNTDSNKSLSSNEFCWDNGDAPESHSILAPAVLEQLKLISSKVNGRPIRILDLGCGNGSFSARMSDLGYDVAACDHSSSGIKMAKESFPQVEFVQLNLNDKLPSQYQRGFDVVVSLEVIEHLFQPRVVFDRAREALGENGYLIVSTPYHGYIKNLALALFNKCDDHWHPLRDYGHIKFFSKNTLIQLVEERRFKVCSFYRVGRIPMLAKSMIIVAELNGLFPRWVI